jgi:hypothetical protein
VRFLDLRGNELTTAGLSGGRDGLVAHRSRLRVLLLGENLLGPGAGAALAESVLGAGSALRALSLAGGYLGDAGARGVAAGAVEMAEDDDDDDAGEKEEEESHGHDSSGHKADPDHHQDDHQHGSPAAAGVPLDRWERLLARRQFAFPGLVELHLGSCGIGAAGAAAVAEIVERCLGLEVLECRGNWEMGDEGARRIAAGIEARALALRNWGGSGDDASAGGERAQQRPRRGPPPPLALGLARCGFGARGIAAVLAAVVVESTEAEASADASAASTRFDSNNDSRQRDQSQPLCALDLRGNVVINDVGSRLSNRVRHLLAAVGRAGHVDVRAPDILHCAQHNEAYALAHPHSAAAADIAAQGPRRRRGPGHRQHHDGAAAGGGEKPPPGQWNIFRSIERFAAARAKPQPGPGSAVVPITKKKRLTRAEMDQFIDRVTAANRKVERARIDDIRRAEARREKSKQRLETIVRNREVFVSRSKNQIRDDE